MKRVVELRGLAKTQTEFGLVAIAHNLLKVAGIRSLLSAKRKKCDVENGPFSTSHFLFRDFLDSPLS
ncbi:hypothetical protein [Lysinibacillus sp. UBA6686]|uniref:hypothetical protein n=1 Tax=Lysinibacillus sp. UBA6686 TaxID=1946776 RepID=UPI00257F7E9B|nr:hypothetical protein [Lysinibacillus sp. UBA6686]